MKACSIFIFLSFFLLSCQETMTTEKVLENALEAHGGVAAWEGISEITYEKTSVLFDSLGNIESEVIKVYRTVFIPELFTEMEWTEDSTNFHASLQNDEVSVAIGDSITAHDALREKYKKELLGAHYVYWQPYNLLEEDAIKEYQGVGQLEGQDRHVLKVNYPKDQNNNTWWYFFDTETFLTAATLVEHGTTFSLIENIVYESKSGLSLNEKRSSYRINKACQKQFLRAQYFYKLLDVQYK